MIVYFGRKQSFMSTYVPGEREIGRKEMREERNERGGKREKEGKREEGGRR